ncbi:MAG: phosphatase PAP2 family protein [Mycobacteriales bacterium]
MRRGLLLSAALVAFAVITPLGVLVRDGWGPLRRWDAQAVRHLALGHGPARDVALALTQLGAPWLLELTVAVLVVVLVRRSNPRLAAYVAVAVIGASLLSTILKHVVARVRPCSPEVLGCPPSSSFPSGHSVGAAAFWTMAVVLLLPRFGRRVWGLLVIPPVVALTRVLLGVHYPSDVVAGLVLGGCWAAGCTALFVTVREAETGRDVALEEGVA